MVIVTKEFTRDAAKSGYIEEDAFAGFTVHAGVNPQIGRDRNAPVKEWRGFLIYDTSAIPDGAIITSVVLVNYVSSTSAGSPDDWKNKFYEANDDGNTLVVGDWNDGEYCVEEDWAGSPTTKDIDLGSKGVDNINKSGWTIVAIRDSSSYRAGQIWSYILDGGRCKLRITWKSGGQIITTRNS